MLNGLYLSLNGGSPQNVRRPTRLPRLPFLVRCQQSGPLFLRLWFGRTQRM
jgi:hypothetical protein